MSQLLNNKVMDLSITGIIKKAYEVKEGVSASGPWKRQTYLIEEDTASYPSSLAFDLFGKQYDEFAPLKEGQKVTAYLNINAREWNGKCFTSLSAWKIEKDNNETEVKAETAQPTAPQSQPEPAPTKSSLIDDLPF